MRVSEPDEEASLARTVRSMVAAMDRKAFSEALRELAADAQLADEISAVWVRGRAAIERHYAEVARDLGEIRSDLTDLAVLVDPGFGIVTAMLDQQYKRGGHVLRVHAPTSFVFRRAEGSWQIVLIHSMPSTPQ